MDTKLIGTTDKCNPIAQNILTGNNFNSDGYPNLTSNELDQVSLKGIDWFTKLISQHIYVASHSCCGIIRIDDQSHAKQLYNNQTEGYRFLTLIQRGKQALGADYYNQSLKKPVVGKSYFLNNCEVIFEGLSHNGQWYVFRYQDHSLQHERPMLVPISHTIDFSKQILLLENSIP